MLIVLIVLALLFFGGCGSMYGSYLGRGAYAGGGVGIGGLLLVLLILWFIGVLR